MDKDEGMLIDECNKYKKTIIFLTYRRYFAFTTKHNIIVRRRESTLSYGT